MQERCILLKRMYAQPWIWLYGQLCTCDFLVAKKWSIRRQLEVSHTGLRSGRSRRRFLSVLFGCISSLLSYSLGGLEKVDEIWEWALLCVIEVDEFYIVRYVAPPKAQSEVQYV